MTIEFIIPKLGDNVLQATVVNWLVDDGAVVAKGDDVLELETDKAVMPLPAPAAGTLKIGPVKAGDVVKISQVVGTITPKNGETVTPPPPASSVETAAESVAATESVAPKATPVAQKMADDLGVDLAAISGSGAHGKVTKDDVRHAAEAKPEAPVSLPPVPVPAAEAAPPTPTPAPVAPPPPATPTTPGDEVQERIPLKGIRGVIARRMAESVHTTARVTLVTDVDATELVALREQLKSRYQKAWGFAPGYNDLLAMIVGNALRQFPYMNARFSADGESIEHLKPVNVGMAVDTDRGLMVTVLRDTDKKGLQEIGSEFREMVNRARAGKATTEDLSGSTFTITSLGIFRVDAFTPVINMPEAAILGVGRIIDKPVVKDGAIVARKMLTLSLVFDHRLTDGAPAARFLDYICELIEEPYLLFLTRK